MTDITKVIPEQIATMTCNYANYAIDCEMGDPFAKRWWLANKLWAPNDTASVEYLPLLTDPDTAP